MATVFHGPARMNKLPIALTGEQLAELPVTDLGHALDEIGAMRFVHRMMDEQWKQEKLRQNRDYWKKKERI